MGGIWIQEADLVDQLIEIVGFKSGVVVPVARALEWINEAGVWFQRPDEGSSLIRIRSEAVEEITAHMLHRVGNVSSPYSGPPTIATYHEFKDDPRARGVYEPVARDLVAFFKDQVGSMPPGSAFDPTPFVMGCLDRHGPVGARIALSFMTNIARHQQVSPWLPSRRVEWNAYSDAKQPAVPIHSSR